MYGSPQTKNGCIGPLKKRSVAGVRYHAAGWNNEDVKQLIKIDPESAFDLGSVNAQVMNYLRQHCAK
jgi:hypothetical protein